MNTLVSIITVTYNVSDTIEKTIDSVLSQTYDNIEYIIVDGMSTDETWEIIGKYRDRISVLIHEPDEGLYYAMNKGIQRATGDIIGSKGQQVTVSAMAVLRRGRSRNGSPLSFGKGDVQSLQVFCGQLCLIQPARKTVHCEALL